MPLSIEQHSVLKQARESLDAVGLLDNVDLSSGSDLDPAQLQHVLDSHLPLLPTLL